MAMPRLFASLSVTNRPASSCTDSSARMTLPAAVSTASLPRLVPATTSGFFAVLRALAMVSAWARVSSSILAGMGAASSRMAATAKPSSAIRAGRRWNSSVATSSRRVAAGTAMNSGL